MTNLIPFGPFRLVNAAFIKEAVFTPPIAATAETPAIKARLTITRTDHAGEFVDGVAAEEAWLSMCGGKANGSAPKAPRKKKATPATAQPSSVE